MTIERLRTNPASGFSDAVTTYGPGKLIHIAGNVGFGPNGMVVSGGMGAEASATLDNIERSLKEVGADLSHVVKINAFVTNLAEYPEYAVVRAERFGDKLPASATVMVAGLLVGAHIEIDAVAFLPDT
jgi:enamine deaminase RidA (YjgF/YER057c/UK114 family)